MTTWYLATCQECEPQLSQPFRDEAKRDEWADAHRDGAGHEVLTSEEQR